MRKNLSKKILLPIIILAIFLAPVSLGVKTDENNNLALKTEIKKAEAITIQELFGSSIISNVTANSNSVNFTLKIIKIDNGLTGTYISGSWQSSTGKGTWAITGGQQENLSGTWWVVEDGEYSIWRPDNGNTTTGDTKGTWEFSVPNSSILLPDITIATGTWVATGGTNGGVGSADWIGSGQVLNDYNNLDTYPNIAGSVYVYIQNEDAVPRQDPIKLPLTSLSPVPVFDLTLLKNEFNLNTGARLENDTNYSIYLFLDGTTDNWTSAVKIPFKTNPYNEQEAGDSKYASTLSSSSSGQAELNLGCTSLTSISLESCVAQLAYIIWSVSAAITRVAAQFLDFFIYYSTNSSSYINSFIDEGWSSIRDIANIFFIIALLFIAIKTILNLNVTNNKKLIGAVIVVALVINFSLFTTKVVIDASNILAKVFYNSIDTKDSKGNPVAEKNGQKSVSLSVVEKFDPQKLTTGQSVFDLNPFGFIFMTLASAVLLLYMTFIFFSVALLFVTRVVSLWMAMIFSPIAFASYTVPFDIPGFGHKEWWKSLLENAMLAPLFVFFLYIIIQFTDFLQNIYSYTEDPSLNAAENGIQHLMSIIIPFFLIAMLLRLARKTAVKYSGELGAGINKLGALAGGLALGAVTGGAALAGTKLIGGHFQNVANNNELRAKAASGDISARRRLDRANKWAGKSFDLRQTGIGRGLSKVTGMNLNGGVVSAVRLSTEKFKGGKKAQFEKKAKEEEEKLKSYEMTKGGERRQNNIARDYQDKRGKAKAEIDINLPKEKEKWEKAYEEKLKEARKKYVGMQPFNEETFKKEYEGEGKNSHPVSSFDEESFKEEYKKTNKVESVETVSRKEENKNRRQAYAWGLAHPNEKKDEKGRVIKKDFDDFSKEFRSGVIKSLTSPTGLATTAIVGALTGGIGLVITPAIVGLATAIKQVVKAQRPINEELVARISTERSAEEEAIDALKKLRLKDKESGEEKNKPKEAPEEKPSKET